jgi:predicted nucleic acid-binding Zn ribbon protein
MKRSKRTSSKHPAEGHHQAPAEYDRDVRSRLAPSGRRSRRPLRHRLPTVAADQGSESALANRSRGCQWSEHRR